MHTAMYSDVRRVTIFSSPLVQLSIGRRLSDKMQDMRVVRNSYPMAGHITLHTAAGRPIRKGLFLRSDNMELWGFEAHFALEICMNILHIHLPRTWPVETDDCVMTTEQLRSK